MDDKLGQRFILVRSPHTLGQLTHSLLYMAVIGNDGIAQILRAVSPGEDTKKLLEWMQPDCDGIRSGQLNWQIARQRELIEGPTKHQAEQARQEAAKKRQPPAQGERMF